MSELSTSANELTELDALLAKYTPSPGTLLVSPIENPGDEAWLELVGHQVMVQPFVIERAGPCANRALARGRVIYANRNSIETVALDREQMFALVFEGAVRLVMDGTPAVKRKTRTPTSAAMMLEQAQNAKLGQKMAKDIAETN